MKYLYKPRNGCAYMKPISVSRDQWNRLIANPMVLPDKKMAPLMIFGDMAPYVELDDRSGLPRCTGANVDNLYALQVDVDNGCTMESFERDFSRYSYQLYTTYSWRNGKEGDRFRVVFPLKEPLKVKWFEGPVKEYLLSLFDMADPTCFDKGHWQVLPCIEAEDKPYRYVQHQGELLSFAAQNFGQMWSEYHEDFHWKREIAKADQDPRQNFAGALHHVQKIFDETQEGSRDRTVYNKVIWLHEMGVPYDDVISLRPPVGFDEEYVRKVNRIYLGRY